MNVENIAIAAVLGISSLLIAFGRDMASKIGNKITGLFTYSVYFDENDELYDVFASWFKENHPDKFRRNELKLIECSEHKYKLKILQLVDNNVVWSGRMPILVSKDRRTLEHAQNLQAMFLNSYSLRSVSKKALNALCEELLVYKINSSKDNMLTVKFNKDWGEYFTRTYEKIKNFDGLFFKAKAELLEDLNSFIQNKPKYNKMGVKYKRGILLYGPPGTGKSSIAMAIANYMDRTLYCINLASIQGDGSLQRLISDVPDNACILFEDIDTVLEQRNTKDGIKFNFATFLNILDGLYAPTDVVFIVTTNKEENLDLAIMRKGRMDTKIEVGLPTNRDVENFINHYYDSKVILCDPHKTSTVPMSAVQDLCLVHPTAEKLLESI